MAQGAPTWPSESARARTSAIRPPANASPYGRSAIGAGRLKTLKPRVAVLRTERVPIMGAVDPDGAGAWRAGKGGANARGYTYRWQKESKAFLREHPLCASCQAQGRITPATVVDHVVPHRGDMEKFWNRSNWQPLCVPCHNKKAQSEK